MGGPGHYGTMGTAVQEWLPGVGPSEPGLLSLCVSGGQHETDLGNAVDK